MFFITHYSSFVVCVPMFLLLFALVGFSEFEKVSQDFDQKKAKPQKIEHPSQSQ